MKLPIPKNQFMKQWLETVDSLTPEKVERLKQLSALHEKERLKNPKYREQLRQHRDWVKKLKQLSLSHEEAINLLAWAYVHTKEVEKEVEHLTAGENETRQILQYLSSMNLPEEIKVLLLKEMPTTRVSTIATLAIKIKSKAVSKKANEKNAEKTKKIEDFAKEKYLLNKEWHELKSASAVATSMVDTYGVRAVGEFNTLRQKIPVWKLGLKSKS